MSRTLSQTKKRASSLKLALLVLFALVLTACGAAVDTSLNLESASKGNRSMQLKISNSDLQNSSSLKGGIEAIDASIQKHLPQELEYSGISSDAEGAQATFTLTFDSLDSYKTKVSSLLKASGSTIEPTIAISNSKEGLVTGLTVRENFSSRDLMGWLNDALKADGVYTGSSGALSSSGDSLVKIDGQEHKSTTSNISISEVTDNGLKQVSVLMTWKEDGGYKGQVALGDSQPLGSVKEGLLDEYLKKNLPEGASIEDAAANTNQAFSSITSGKVVSFDAKDSDEFSQKLQKLLGSADNRVKVTDAISETDKTLFIATVEANLNCAVVCSPSGSGISFQTQVPNHWESAPSTDSSSSSYFQSSSSALTYSRASRYTHRLDFNKVDFTLELNSSAGGKAIFVYELPTEQANLSGDALKDFLAPSEESKIEQEEADGNTTYTVTIEGGNAEELSSRLSDYIPGSSISQQDAKSPFGFTRSYFLSADIPFSSSSYEGILQDNFTYTLKLPGMHSFDNSGINGIEGPSGSEYVIGESQSLSSKSAIRATVKAPAWVNIIIIILLVLIAVAALVWFIKWRKSRPTPPPAPAFVPAAEEATVPLNQNWQAGAAAEQDLTAPTVPLADISGQGLVGQAGEAEPVVADTSSTQANNPDGKLL